MLDFQAGRASAFEQLYARHRGPLYRFFARQVNAMVVEDLFQETWLRIIRAREDYRAGAPFGAYLYRIAHNVLVDHYRRQANVATPVASDSLDPPDGSPGPDEQAGEQQLRAAFLAALAALPAEQREAFLLHEEGGLTLEQIAKVVGTGRETIKSRLRYAVGRLRKALEPQIESTEERL